jgi:hypothetical protein
MLRSSPQTSFLDEPHFHFSGRWPFCNRFSAIVTVFPALSALLRELSDEYRIGEHGL